VHRFNATDNGREVQAGLTRYFDFYNRERIHQSHEYQTPDEIYFAPLLATYCAGGSQALAPVVCHVRWD